MSIGDKWSALGAMDKESSFKLLDAFYEAGGNFIDTACNYQDETSEMFIGEWMETRGIRDQMVIGTRVRFDHELPTARIGNAYVGLFAVLAEPEARADRHQTTHGVGGQ